MPVEMPGSARPPAPIRREPRLAPMVAAPASAPSAAAVPICVGAPRARLVAVRCDAGMKAFPATEDRPRRRVARPCERFWSPTLSFAAAEAGIGNPLDEDGYSEAAIRADDRRPRSAGRSSAPASYVPAWSPSAATPAWRPAPLPAAENRPRRCAVRPLRTILVADALVRGGGTWNRKPARRDGYSEAAIRADDRRPRAAG